MVRMVVDRREGRYLILIPEDDPEEEVQIPVRILKGLKEGEIIELSYVKDEKASKEARERIGDQIIRLKDY